MTDHRQVMQQALDALCMPCDRWNRTQAMIVRAAIESLRSALAAAPQAEPLFLLHTGQIDSDGEQDEWETEADSQVRVDAFCRQHPGQTIGLYPAPAADVVRDAWQPIETAPKNRSRVLLWWDGAVREGWCAGAGKSRDGGDWWRSHSLQMAQGRPTHWMPLPPAPDAAMKGSDQ